ncbi:MAG: leucyl aminopeptidase family protein [Pseudomonadota bacterium]
MGKTTAAARAFTPRDLFARASEGKGQAKADSVPLWLTQNPDALVKKDQLTPVQRAWLSSCGFTGRQGAHVLLPGREGKLAGVVAGTIKKAAGPMDDARALGHLGAQLPSGTYHVAGPKLDPTLAGIAWGLGAYSFSAYRDGPARTPPVLLLERKADLDSIVAQLEAVWLGRDLINRPSNDMGPAELEAVTREVAAAFEADVTSIRGAELQQRNFPLIHAVGRASDREPRLIDLRWGTSGPRVTVVGKGVCFDTGGLNLKPSAGMLLMKKDMGGAASALALAQMVMAHGLNVRLRLLIPAVENAVAGSAFRPGDIITSRAGPSVEIGNTDAEGRLVLADAMALACEERPDLLLTFATLTGAARVALGPDLPPFFTDDESLAAALTDAGDKVGDPVWRLPFWSGYERMLDSPTADMNNIAFNGFAGSILAALFLRRFARKARRYAHFDIYGWRPEHDPLGPKGGEPQAARAAFKVIANESKAT